MMGPLIHCHPVVQLQCQAQPRSGLLAPQALGALFVSCAVQQFLCCVACTCQVDIEASGRDDILGHLETLCDHPVSLLWLSKGHQVFLTM
jgi:hypothetical protein